MLKFACKITGDDYQMLNSETPSSRKKVIVLGLSVFVPTILWFINGLLLTYAVLEKSILAAILVGLIASLIIFLIEKLVVMSNGSRSLTIFRGILAFLVAILGSVFMDEVIFVKDINQQLSVNKNLLLEQRQNEVRIKYSAELSTQEQLVNRKYDIWHTTQAEAQREADGTGGSGVKGVHAITRLKMENASINQSDYLTAKSDLEALTMKIRNEKEQVTSQIESSFENNALLNRIKAMFDLAFSNIYMGVFYIVVTLILFVLEFLVIIFKTTMKKTNYEYRLELIEEIGRKRMDKVRQNDIAHFEPGRVYPEYKNASQQILSKTGSASLFN
jgi:hypothetical protein